MTFQTANLPLTQGYKMSLRQLERRVARLMDIEVMGVGEDTGTASPLRGVPERATGACGNLDAPPGGARESVPM